MVKAKGDTGRTGEACPTGAPTVPVTVVMAVRDEAEYIAQAVGAVLGQHYPEALLNVVIADGASTDGTREELQRIAEGDSRVVVVDNPERIVPTGLNAAIRLATGEVIIRVDGHCDIDPDFVAQSVAVLDGHPEAWAVGGPIVHRGRGPFGRATAYAMSSPVGVGGASHRFESFEGYSDSVAFPAFRRDVFDRVGSFDEDLVRNQDDELNFRITQAGGKIFVSPRIGYRYFVREHPKQLFRQYYQYAFWRLPMLKKHGRPTTLRQLVPPLFYVAMAATAAVGFVSNRPLLGLAVPAAYGGALAAFGITSTRELDLRAAGLVPLAVVILHSSYAAGWFAGVWATLTGSDAWDRRRASAHLSR